MNNLHRQRRYTIFAIIMVALMGMTAILPSLNTSTTTQQSVEPTATILPTFPAPPADLSTVVFDQVYLHPSALYLANYPADWVPTRPNNNGTQVQVYASLRSVDIMLFLPQRAGRDAAQCLPVPWLRAQYRETGRQAG